TRRDLMKRDPMKCKDIMTDNPIFCLPTDPAQKAAALMQEHICGLLPIVNSEFKRKLIGVVTDRDLCINVVAVWRVPKLGDVEECMTKMTASCRPEDGVEKCLEILQENQIRRLPVCDDRGKLIGIITLADIVCKANISSEKALNALK